MSLPRRSFRGSITPGNDFKDDDILSYDFISYEFTDDNTDDHPTCSNGVVGYEGANEHGVACCPIGCTKCGGSGCRQLATEAGLDKSDCCVGGIIDNHLPCPDADMTAPCVVFMA